LTFHVELRQFPHMTREFNLEREQLDARVLRPWVRDEAIELGDRRWAPDRAKLAVYEGRALDGDEIGMGRGWGNVTKTAEEVTARVLDEVRRAVASPPALNQLKALLVARADRQPLKMAAVLGLAGEIQSDSSKNERVELAHRAIWELLQEERLMLSAGS
jgi:hypothetical protein